MKNVSMMLLLVTVLLVWTTGCAGDDRTTIIWTPEGGWERQEPSRWTVATRRITSPQMVKIVYLISLLTGLIMLKKRANIIAAILFFISAACFMPWLYAMRRRFFMMTWNRVYETYIFDIGLIWYLMIGAVCLVLGFIFIFKTKDKDAEFESLVKKLKTETDAERRDNR